jgi:hypothetical protein
MRPESTGLRLSTDGAAVVALAMLRPEPGRMSRRRSSSPYSDPPSGYVRALMRAGWRRCDAEAIEVVRLSLSHADDPQNVRTWAERAAKALASEPVLAGAIYRLAADDGVVQASLGLFLAAPDGQRTGLSYLFNAAMHRAESEAVLEQRYLDSLAEEDDDEEDDERYRLPG